MQGIRAKEFDHVQSLSRAPHGTHDAFCEHLRNLKAKRKHAPNPRRRHDKYTAHLRAAHANSKPAKFIRWKRATAHNPSCSCYCVGPHLCWAPGTSNQERPGKHARTRTLKRPSAWTVRSNCVKSPCTCVWAAGTLVSESGRDEDASSARSNWPAKYCIGGPSGPAIFPNQRDSFGSGHSCKSKVKIAHRQGDTAIGGAV